MARPSYDGGGKITGITNVHTGEERKGSDKFIGKTRRDFRKSNFINALALHIGGKTQPRKSARPTKKSLLGTSSSSETTTTGGTASLLGRST